MPRADSRLNIDVITAPGDVSRIGADCDRLAAQAEWPLLRHDWLQACATAFADKGNLRLFYASDVSGVRAVVPLVEESDAIGSRLCMLGHQLGEPDKFGFDDGAALTAVCEEICRARLPLVVRRLPQGGTDAERLRGATSAHGLSIYRHASTQSAWAPLDGDWEVFERGMSGNSRRLVRKRLRSASEAGPVSFEVLIPDESSVDAELDRFIRIEAAGWKSRAGTSIARNPHLDRFYRMYARSTARTGLLRMMFLKIGETTVAGRIAVVFSRRLWEIKIGYDERWSQFAPGILLTHFTLQHACEAELRAHEYLGSAEDWQQRWPVQVRDHDTVRFYPRSVRGGLAFTADSLSHLNSTFARRRQSPASAGAA